MSAKLKTRNLRIRTLWARHGFPRRVAAECRLYASRRQADQGFILMANLRRIHFT